MKRQVFPLRVSYSWLRAGWTATICGMTALALSRFPTYIGQDHLPISDAAALAALFAPLVMALNGVPDRWLPGKIWVGIASKWSRLVLVPAALVVLFGGQERPAGVSPWLAMGGGIGVYLEALAGIVLWCAAQIMLRPTKLFFLIRREQAVRLLLSQGLLHLLHNGVPEEVYFRIFLQTWLTYRLGNAAAALTLSALLFGLSHMLWRGRLSYGEAVRDALLVQAPMGAFLGTLWSATNSLPTIALCHALLNTVAGLEQATVDRLSGRVVRRTHVNLLPGG